MTIFADEMDLETETWTITFSDETTSTCLGGEGDASSFNPTISYNTPVILPPHWGIICIFAKKKPNEKMRQYIKKYLLLLMSILISIVANAYDFEVGGIYYNKDGNCAIVTSGDSKYSGDVSIPSTVNYGGMEYSVTGIDGGAFQDCTGLTSVTIPNSVTIIGYGAFEGCTGLTSVTIGNSVTSIGDYAFNNCSGLTSVTIPNSVTSIGNFAFTYCSGLTSVIIPNSVATIGEGAFGYCSGLTSVTIPNSVTSIESHVFTSCYSLTSVTIPNSVTSIGDHAFSGCYGLTSVTIPNSVTSIGDGAFSRCSGLTSIKVETENTTYDSRNDCNAIIETASNTLVAGCENTVIPNSVTSIGGSAFYGCTGLTSVIIPNSVTSIGDYAFGECSNLKSVISEIEVPFTIDSDVFDSDTETNGKLTVPKGKKSVYQSTGGWKEFSNIVESISSYTLTIQSSSGGSVSYNDANISATTKTFTIDEESSVTFTITPNTGYYLSKLTVNDTDVTTSVSNNQYTISNITANTSVVATFEQIPVTGIEVNATNFPDENFRTYIFEMVEGADDAILTDEEIAKVTDIDCSAPPEDLKIYSLKGIEFFSALKRLVCADNRLTSLDVSKNQALTSLYCSNNQLTSLDISKNPVLTSLACHNNQLTSLDVSNTALTILDCGLNQLTSLDVSKNTALTELDCSYNQLTSLDVSKNTALTELDCSNNQLTNIDLSNNASISSASLSSQSLSLEAVSHSSLGVAIPVSADFDFKKVSNLRFAGASVSGSVTDVDGQQYLVFAKTGTDISSIKGKTLSYSYSSGNSTAGEMSVSITIGEVIQQYTIVFYPYEYDSSYIYVRDRNGKEYRLTGDALSNNRIDAGSYVIVQPFIGASLYVSEIIVNGTSIGKWDDEDTAPQEYIIESLSCDMEINFSTSLRKQWRTLSCRVVGRGQVQMYRNESYVGTSNNYISDVFDEGDVLKLVFVPDEGCNFKKLIVYEPGYGPEEGTDYTDVVNGNMFVMKWGGGEYMDMYDPRRNFEVHFEGYPITLSPSNFPDANFRAYLSSLTGVAEGGSLTDDILQSVTNIDVHGKNISNLQGIAFFSELRFLNCSNNQLKNIDVSNNNKIYQFNCSNNQLTVLDVSKLTILDQLLCNGNQLKSLDVSNSINLYGLNCSDNLLSTLDVSNNTKLLSYLYCVNNQLSGLDVSKNIYLKKLSCGTNKLTSLDVSSCKGLTDLDCSTNQLMDLELSKNTRISTASIGSQLLSLKTINTNAGIAIPVPSDFDFTKVSNLKLAGKSVTGSLTTVDGQKYLVFAQTGAAQSTIDGKQLTYNYITGNSFSDAASMDVTVSLSYAPKTYTLSIQAGNGGSVSYDGTTITNTTKSFTVAEGTSATITISPNIGYRLSRLTVNGTNVTSNVSNNQYTISNITANTTVIATFEQIPATTYSLSIQSGASGSVTYDGTTITNKTQSFTVNEGTSATITITPNTGYRLSRLTVNGTNVTSSVKDNQYTISSITANTTVVATFEQIPATTYSLSIQSRSGGSVTYNETTVKNTTQIFTVNEGVSATITITPDSGYRLASLTVNGTNVTSSVKNNQYTISNITTNTTVVTTFEEIPVTTYSLSIQSGAGGSVSYNGTTITNKTQSFTVAEGTSATITISPNTGYKLSKLTVNGTNVTSNVKDNQYTISSIAENTTVVATFEQITYTLSVQATGNGTVTYNSTGTKNTTHSFTVNHGSSATLTISADNGYRLASLTVNGTNVTSSVSNNQYTISNITANTTVVATFEQIPVTTYSLSIQSGAGGSVSYDGTTITNKTQSFTIAEGSSVTIVITPSSGYKLASLTVNGTDVKSGVENHQYTISNITGNTTVVVTFKAIPQSITQDGINYVLASAADYTLNVGRGDYSGHVVIPATVSYDGDTWTVAGVVDGAFNLSAITAITWNPNTAIGDGAFGAQTNPNLLLYVKSEAYAPTNVQNVIANGRARKIVLTDAASGNDFNCPEAFTAEEISYTHRYGMTTGIGECRGWETIALPFDVKQFTHESKGTLIPFKVFSSTSAGKPFWLYRLTASGWQEAANIEANTPYIISLPNNKVYDNDYNLPGVMTFSSNNVTVPVTEAVRSTYGDRTFVANFTSQSSSWSIYALNVNNDYSTYSDYLPEGSTFIRELRTVHPFEAYMMNSSGNAKQFLPLFETLPTAIREIPMQAMRGMKGVRIYSMSGELIMFDQNISIEEALKQLKRGVYFVNGKKMVVK